jgi:hypothetical protein
MSDSADTPTHQPQIELPSNWKDMSTEEKDIWVSEALKHLLE